ncbi:hypothetical protein KSS87_015684 [Heliosperma pusillum]|nr:hypothetical protein KSS87_015684 [Heliosperma pusillum]
MSQQLSPMLLFNVLNHHIILIFLLFFPPFFNASLACSNANCQISGLPFNKYTWLVTHNAFSNVNAPPLPGVQRITFYNQEDTVTNQLRVTFEQSEYLLFLIYYMVNGLDPYNGVRGLMLDMYDFQDDIWLCHSFQGQCYNITAFGTAIDTLREVEAFLSSNPSEIVTIIIEDYVHAPKGLTRLFANAGLDKYWYPMSKMPRKGEDWPTVNDMVQQNHRLVVFTSDASKEESEGIAYQWRYMLENESGDPGVKEGSCPNRKESKKLNSKSSSLFLMNYFPTYPVEDEACKENSAPLAEMVGTCYKVAGNVMPNFVAVNFYLRSDGPGVFDILDRMNGRTLCGCNTVTACQPGSPFGVCKNIPAPSIATPTTPSFTGPVEKSNVEAAGRFKGELSYLLQRRFLSSLYRCPIITFRLAPLQADHEFA